MLGRALAAAVLVALIGPAAAQASPGLTCPDGLRHHPNRAVVLLVHGTATTATESWSEGFGKSLHVAGFDWCMVQLPGRELGDIQASNTYVTAAVRDLARRTHRKVSLAGHSQGGLQVRWAVRWFPAVRKNVDDVITFAGANDGVYSASGVCAGGSCFPSAWQMSVGSNLEAALNRRPMPKGPSYTAIYSDTDELVQPTTSGQFAGASNIHIQGICPGRYVGHVQQVYDAVAIAAALDALEHRGPANVDRIGTGHCAEVYGPGIDPGQATAAIETLYTNAAVAVARASTITAEPPLRPYARKG